MVFQDSVQPRSDISRIDISEVLRKREPRPAWTKSELAILTELYHKGKSAEWIAHEVNRSIAAVRLMANRLGLKRVGAATEQDSNTISTMTKKRATDRDIASRIASLLGEAPRIEVEARFIRLSHMRTKTYIA